MASLDREMLKRESVGGVGGVGVEGGWGWRTSGGVKRPDTKANSLMWKNICSSDSHLCVNCWMFSATKEVSPINHVIKSFR